MINDYVTLIYIIMLMQLWASVGWRVINDNVGEDNFKKFCAPIFEEVYVYTMKGVS